MISIRKTMSVTRKELQSYLDNPASYIALVVFVLLWQYLFFKNIFLISEASLRSMYDYLPYILMFFVPAVTMNAFSREKQEGTLELVMTHPVSELEVLLGKYISSLLFVVISLLFSLPVFLSLSYFGVFDVGIYFSQVLSSVFLAGCLSSLGIFLSLYFSNSIAALLTSIAASFFLIIIGSEFITVGMPLVLVPVLERLSILSHVSSMARGVIDLSDVWYFFSFILIFLSLSYLEMMKFKYGNRKKKILSLRFGTFLFIGIFILMSVIGSRIPGRIDLTSGQIYSLSEKTRQKLSSLDDIVTITLYSSSRLPGQLAPVVRQVKDILRDYSTASNGNIQVIYKDTSGSPEVSEEASSRGVREIQFNVIGSEEFQVKTGFLGLVVSFAGESEVIPYIEDTSDLEYQLTSFITKLTIEDKKEIAFLVGHGEKDITREYALFSEELGKQFDLVPLDLSDEDVPEATTSSLLVVAGPVSEIGQTEKENIREYLNSERGVLFLLDSVSINTQMLTTVPVESGIEEILSEYGIGLQDGIVYDLKSHETIRLGTGGGFGLFVPYPYWVRAGVEKDSFQALNNIEEVLIPWPGSISFDQEKLDDKGLRVVNILTTSEYASLATGNIDISPDSADFSEEGLGEKILAAALVPKEKEGESTPKIILVADSDFLTDEYTSTSGQNLAFGSSLISLMTSEESLAGIRIKQSQSRRLVIRSEIAPTVVKYSNMSAVVLIPFAISFYRIMRRRKLGNKTYERKT